MTSFPYSAPLRKANAEAECHREISIHIRSDFLTGVHDSAISGSPHSTAGVPRGDVRYARLQRLTARLNEEYRAGSAAAAREDPLWRRSHAAAAVSLALLPPAHTPLPLHCLREARLALGDDWQALRSRLHSLLGRQAS